MPTFPQLRSQLHGLVRSDGKTPDSLANRQMHDVEYVTVTNTLAESYLSATSSSAGSAAETAAKELLFRCHCCVVHVKSAIRLGVVRSSKQQKLMN